MTFFPAGEKTDPQDAFAEAVWSPGGIFRRAPEAVTAGADKNILRVEMLK